METCIDDDIEVNQTTCHSLLNLMLYTADAILRQSYSNLITTIILPKVSNFLHVAPAGHIPPVGDVITTQVLMLQVVGMLPHVQH